MPWNEPGGNKDPWSGNRGGEKGPPDLDDIFRKLTGGFGRVFGGGGKGGSSAGVFVIIVLVLLAWLASGWYIVSAGEKGVVLQFGKFRELKDPGLRWHLPYPIESREIVDIARVRDTLHHATMLTQDENIVDIEIVVQYRVKDAYDYSFNVRFPDAPAGTGTSRGTLYQVMESAVREVVGKSKMDYILGEGRAEIASSTKVLMQEILDDYKTGLEIISINMQQAQPPEAVQGAFADAIKAREDEVRYRNEAEAYANSVIPEARGQAARLEQEASAYRDQVIAKAEGEASRFTQLLTEYEKAPRVTRERLYLDAVEAMLTQSSTVVVDVKGGNNLLYLPLDKMLSNRGSGTPASSSATGGAPLALPPTPSGSTDETRRRSTRGREVR